MIDSLINSLEAQLALFESNSPQERTKYDYISLQTPIEQFVPLIASTSDESFFLTKPDSGFSLLGLGSMLTLQAEGRNRLKSIKSDYSKILNNWFNNKHVPPIAFMAFAFDENDPMTDNWAHFPNMFLTVPVVMIKEINSCQSLQVNIKLGQTSYSNTFKHIKKRLNLYLDQAEQLTSASKETTRLNINTRQASAEECPLAEGSSPAKSSWQTLAYNAITEIQSGRFDKLVTSRKLSLQTQSSISVPALMQKLIKHYPACTIFSYQQSEINIVAASPERLLTLQHPDIQSDAIGGTIQRKKHLGNNLSSAKPALLPFLFKQSPFHAEPESSESKKLLKEHAFITQDIYQRLDPLCNTLKMPISPLLMKLHNLYHLETPIQGKLMPDHDLFDVIETLHPTPAVAGFPAQEAKQWLLENENYCRGWYTGAFGWLDGIHDGELIVMLRCALIKDRQVDLFAGAGLVAESVPEIEWQETELKMQTILEML